MLNKKIFVFPVLYILASLIVHADPAGDIARVGDEAWNNLIAQSRREGRLMDPVSANVVVNNFDRYREKIMLFPAIDFGDFITDREGNRYYYYGERNSLNIFIIKYHPGIQDLLLMLNSGLGNMGGRYEVMGTIVDAWEWWGNVVHMEVAAVRVQNRACILMQNNSPVLVGRDIFDRHMAGLAASWSAGIPQNPTSVPADLEPEMVAKWFLYFGSINRNETIWKQLCSVQEGAISSSGTLQAKGQSWWRMLSMADREYYFIRHEPSRGDTPTTRVYMTQFRVNGQDVGTARPMFVTRENTGQWKVSGFN